MRPETNQMNEKYLQKLEILQTFILDIIEADTFEEITKHVFDALQATIDPYLMGVSRVRLGALQGYAKIKGEEIKSGHVGIGLPLDGPGIMVKAVNTRKICNVPDTREDPTYVIVEAGGGVHTLSEIAVPILVHGKSIGVVNIEEMESHAFDESDQEILKALAGYTGVSLSNIRYSNRLSSLHRHTSQLSMLTSVGEVAEQTLDDMTTTLELETCTFLQSQNGELKPILEKGLDKTIQLREKANELPSLHDRLREAEKLDFLSELETPIIVDDEVVAILRAKSIRADAYSKQDSELLETLANHVASAIQRIRRLEAQIQYETKLEALHLHTSKLTDAESIDEIADYTIDAMETTLGFTWINMAIVEDNFITTVINSSTSRRRPSIGSRTREESDPSDPDYKWHLDGPGIIVKAVNTKKTILISDIREDPSYFEYGGKKAKRDRLLSELCVPVVSDGKVVAVLNTESTQLDFYDERDQVLLEILASHVASAMMRLQHNKERELAQQELALEQLRVEQADELSRLKNQFISTATHELRTPVTSILGFLELVLDYSSEDLPDTVRKDLNVVFRNAMRLVDMTNDLLDVQRITSGRFEVNLEQVDLVNTLNEVVEELTPMFTEKQQVLTVEAPSELSVNVDEVRISQLFINLLRNANKFTPAEGNIGVKVEPFESHVQISVKDSGIGLSEEDIEKLFKPFPAIRHGVNVSSTGLGLAICKGIVDVHMGVIWVESDGPGQGCTFIVRLPITQ